MKKVYSLIISGIIVFSGISFPLSSLNNISAQSEELVQVFRYWNDSSTGHFYTTDVNEKVYLDDIDPFFRL